MAAPELRREIGLGSAVMITVGSVIGSGIFLKPLLISRSLPGEAWVHLAWMGVGVVCLLGALAYAELGAALPEAGGTYAFLREAWGPLAAFLYGWTLFFVINTGTLAALAAAFADNLAEFLSRVGGGRAAPAPWIRNALAAGMILGLAAINHFGARAGAWVQNLATAAKLLALGAIAFGGLLMPAMSAGPSAAAAATGNQPEFLPGLVAAGVAIFWAYEGWYQLPFNAAELRNPRRDLPWGLVLGMLILIVTYVGVNAIYLRAVPFGEMRSMDSALDVPRTAVERIFDPSLGAWVTALIALSVFGAGNPNLLSSPRAFWAMARDGALPKALLAVHPRFGTPHVAIWVQAVWAIVLLAVLRGFHDLTDYVVFASLLFYAAAVAGVYALRRKRPELPRPFRCWGYPLTPAVFIAVTLFVDFRTLFDPAGRTNALYGLGIVAAGLPAWWVLRRKS